MDDVPADGDKKYADWIAEILRLPEIQARDLYVFIQVANPNEAGKDLKNKPGIRLRHVPVGGARWFRVRR